MAEQISWQEWAQEGARKFGSNPMEWRFVCPSCGHVAAASEWIELGAPQNAVGFACVGNWMAVAAPVGSSTGPCVYQGSVGDLSPIHLIDEAGTTFPMFAFADPIPDAVPPEDAA